MSILQALGAITTFLGVSGALYAVFVQNRGVDQTGRIEGERLGHDELVAALNAQRDRIAAAEKRADDLEKRTSRAEQREAECNRKVSVLELQVTELLWSMERRGE